MTPGGVTLPRDAASEMEVRFDVGRSEDHGRAGRSGVPEGGEVGGMVRAEGAGRTGSTVARSTRGS